MPSKRRGRPKKPRTWQDRLVLKPGESVRQVQRITRGNLDQDEVEHHEVIDAQGQIVGTVIYTINISLKPPFVTRYWLEQTDLAGKAIVEVRW